MSTPLGILGRRNADTTRPAPSGFGCQPSPPAGQPSRTPTTLANLRGIPNLSATPHHLNASDLLKSVD